MDAQNIITGYGSTVNEIILTIMVVVGNITRPCTGLQFISFFRTDVHISLIFTSGFDVKRRRETT